MYLPAGQLLREMMPVGTGAGWVGAERLGEAGPAACLWDLCGGVGGTGAKGPADLCKSGLSLSLR